MKEENGTRHEQQVRRLDLLQRNFETDIANYELETTEDIYDEDQDVIVRDLVFTRGMGRHEILVNPYGQIRSCDSDAPPDLIQQIANVGIWNEYQIMHNH